MAAEQTLRPCIVDGRKALFHRWADRIRKKNGGSAK